MAKLFILQPEELTPSRVTELYKVDWSEENSNSRSAEEDAMFALEAFLQYCASMSAIRLSRYDKWWSDETLTNRKLYFLCMFPMLHFFSLNTCIKGTTVKQDAWKSLNHTLAAAES